MLVHPSVQVSFCRSVILLREEKLKWKLHSPEFCFALFKDILGEK